MTHRREVEAILAGARAEHRALLAQVSPALAASLPVDATGITQAIDHLAGAGSRAPAGVASRSVGVRAPRRGSHTPEGLNLRHGD